MWAAVLFYTFDIYRSYALDQTDFCPSFLTLIFAPLSPPLLLPYLYSSPQFLWQQPCLESLLFVLPFSGHKMTSWLFTTLQMIEVEPNAADFKATPNPAKYLEHSACFT